MGNCCSRCAISGGSCAGARPMGGTRMPASRFHTRYRRTMGDPSAVFQQTVNAQVQSYGAQGAAYVAQTTGVDVTNTRAAAGASAAAQLATNGFDPTSASDRNAMVAVIAGGLSLIPGVGPILGGALETLYQIAQPLACPTAKFFHAIGISQSDCDTPPCSYSGPAATPASIWQNFDVPVGAKQPGSFAQFAWGALTTNAASAAVCRSSVPNSVIVDAVVAQWNATHAGPSAPVWVPPLNNDTLGVPIPLVPEWQSGTGWGSSGGIDPNVWYAFLPSSLVPWGTNLAGAPPVPPTAHYDPARYVQVNMGALVGARSGTRLINLAPIVRASTALGVPLRTTVPGTPAAKSSSTATMVIVAGGVAALALAALRVSRGLPAVPRVRRVRSLRDLLR